MAVALQRVAKGDYGDSRAGLMRRGNSIPTVRIDVDRPI